MELETGVTPVSSASEHDWFLHEDELTPDHIRSLGHLLYDIMFDAPASVVDMRARRGHPEWESDEGYFVGVNGNTSPPAELYAENYAEAHSLPVGALKRWVHQASREIAAVSIGTLPNYYKESPIRFYRRKSELAADVAAAARVRGLGIRASVEDHRRMFKAARGAGIQLVHQGDTPTSPTSTEDLTED